MSALFTSSTNPDISSIRRTFNDKDKKWYFSVIDVIALITDTTDARNYWKATKSRFTKTNPQLVTGCIQLKLPSGDGKSYATDTGDAELICGIVTAISPTHAQQFHQWFDEFEYRNTKDIHSPTSIDADLQIDMYDTPTEIIVQCFLAGVAPSDILITANYHHLSIRGIRSLVADPTHICIQQELYWGTFGREITIDNAIEVTQISAHESHGLLTIKVPKIDTARTRVIKISSSK